MDCESGCGREAKEGALCYACARAKRRNGTTRRTHPERGTRYKTPQEAMRVASAALVEAEGEEPTIYNRAWRRFLMASLRYRRKIKLRQPAVPREKHSPTE